MSSESQEIHQDTDSPIHDEGPTQPFPTKEIGPLNDLLGRIRSKRAGLLPTRPATTTDPSDITTAQLRREGDIVRARTLKIEHDELENADNLMRGVIGLVSDELNLPEDSENNPFFILAFAEEYPLARSDMKDGEEMTKTLAAARIAGRHAVRRMRDQMQILTLQGINTELHNRYEGAKEDSQKDELTKIPNRRAFNRNLFRYILNGDKKGTVLIGDVNGLKRLNDNYGHPAGDSLLIETARAFDSTTRATDLAARYGGDEFAMILPNTSLNEAKVIADRLKNELQKREVKGLVPGGISLGAGIVEINPADFEGLDITEIKIKLDDVLLQAEGAMYAAKEFAKANPNERQKVLPVGTPEGHARYLILKAEKDAEELERNSVR